MKKITLILFAVAALVSCKNSDNKEDANNESSSVDNEMTEETENENKDSIPVWPVSHASFAIQLNGKTIYFDPVGNASEYKDLPKADLVVLTDIHQDHMSPQTIDSITNGEVPIVAPQAVQDQFPKNLQGRVQVMNNGDVNNYFDIEIKAIPMYNLREEAKQMHTKGRGNGYVLTSNGKKIYVSGDTEDIPEMRSLTGIDVAFICMNLPYTMPVDSAIDAVLDFKPKKVYPYHYRGQDGLSDVDRFKAEVEKENSNIDVVLLNWYPNGTNK